VIGRSPARQALRRFVRNRFALVCAGIFGLLALGSIVVPWGGDPNTPDLTRTLQPPSSDARFGTDALGRDLVLRTFWGCRVTFAIGLCATAIGVVIGIAYGGISGYAGGRLDAWLMRLVDVLYGLPLLVFTMLVIEVFKDAGESIGFKERMWLWNIILIFVAVGSIGWLTTARIVRGQVLSLKEKEFVESARALGAGAGRILRVHLVPNLLGPVIVYATLTLPSVMLFESFISFLGLGIKDPNASLGLLMEDGAKQLIPTKVYWWLLAFPGAILAVSVFCLNAIGDGLRDALDVQQERS
jgi:oligopeptide transport system permease protein